MDKRRAIQIMTRAAQPTYKVFAVISKHYTDDKYSNLAKIDKTFDLKEYYFSETIENMIDRKKL